MHPVGYYITSSSALTKRGGKKRITSCREKRPHGVNKENEVMMSKDGAARTEPVLVQADKEYDQYKGGTCKEKCVLQRFFYATRGNVQRQLVDSSNSCLLGFCKNSAKWSLSHFCSENFDISHTEM
jgi:hypothetical protein